MKKSVLANLGKQLDIFTWKSNFHCLTQLDNQMVHHIARKQKFII